MFVNEQVYYYIIIYIIYLYVLNIFDTGGFGNDNCFLGANDDGSIKYIKNINYFHHYL